MAKITRERAERIARAHACENCGEYNYKKLIVKPAAKGNRTELNEAWIAKKTCGVCGLQAEMGIDAEGEIVWVTQP
jgi:transcription elongation factor Elf1